MKEIKVKSVGKVRITSGIFRGRTILTPLDSKTHPMGDREKLALFNMVSEFIANKTVLDAFSGSGALGIEALSRGAKKVVFIEESVKADRIIRKNLESLGISEASYEVILGDVGDYINKEKFDLIIADPPYDDFQPALIESLAKNLALNGFLVLSHPDGAPELKGLKLLKSRKYARARLSVYAYA